MKLPRLDPATKDFYDSVLPSDRRVETRSMFGGLGSFVNGNMFAGALGKQMFLRLPDADRTALLREPGGGPFEPIKGRTMAEYATVPKLWMMDPDRVREWVSRSLEWVAALPPKKGKKKAPARKK
ncbi:MAG TPA: TfoX/Sxy family protein [Thermoplasmata archaeon]|nr:TfoX/Sxy family protein [Thermoplasmata archaeon]